MSDLTLSILQGVVTKSGALRELFAREEAALERLFAAEGVAAPFARGPLAELAGPAENRGELFAAAKKEIAAIEPLYLYLPVDLPESTLKEILVKLRDDYGESFLLEVKSDPELIGGCALAYRGQYKDYSLRAKLASQGVALRA